MALTLATYNTVQISKLETRIEAQECKTDVLTNTSKLHKNPLHKLDTMVYNIGEEFKVIKVKEQFQVSMDQILAQINLDEQKLLAVVATFEHLIHTAFDQKLVPGVLSNDILIMIVNHLKNVANTNNSHNFIHQQADLYKREASFIH